MYYFNSKDVTTGFSLTSDYQNRQTSKDGLGQAVFSSRNSMFMT